MGSLTIHDILFSDKVTASVDAYLKVLVHCRLFKMYIFGREDCVKLLRNLLIYSYIPFKN